METKIIHIINNAENNAKTAPLLRLHRPKIHYGRALLYFIAHFFIGYIITFLFKLFGENDFVSASLWSLKHFYITVLFLFLITLRFSFMWFVRLYQRYAKAETRLRCCMTPFCSEYAILALKKYGVIIGIIKIVRRLKRCHPPGGIDYP